MCFLVLIQLYLTWGCRICKLLKDRIHSASLRTCNIYEREKEIMKVKYRRNITLLEARKIMEFFMKINVYGNVAQKACPISNNIDQLEKYRALIKKKLVQSSRKSLCSSQIKRNHNAHKTVPKISTENSKFLTKMTTVKKKKSKIYLSTDSQNKSRTKC